MKLFFLTFFLTWAIIECSIFKDISCKTAVPMSNFDYTKFLGVWYNWASSSNYDDVDVNCFKKNYYTLFSNNTLYFEESFLNPDGSLDDSNTTRQVDPTRPGVIKASKTVTLTGFFGNSYETKIPVDSVIIYTDYTNVQVRYSCSNLNNFWSQGKFEYYFVLVRNRSFDSVKLLAPVLQALKSLGANVTDMVLLQNNNCTN